MNELLMMSLFGFVLFVLGILFFKRDGKLYENTVVTSAKVVDYYEYHDTYQVTMCTMIAEYKIQDGTIIRAKEQRGSNRKKYSIGTELKIYYSVKRPDLFIVCGDNARKYAFYGMMLVGLAMVVLFGYMYLKGIAA